MKRTGEATWYECDACGFAFLMVTGQRPEGIYGTLEEILRTDDNNEWSEGEKVWYACRRAHVARAIKNVLEGIRGGS